MSTFPTESATETVEVQVLAGIDHGKSRCFILESHPSADARAIEYLVKKGTYYDTKDDPTARTETSSEYDDYSIEEKFSLSSLYLADTGTFPSQYSSFDNPRQSPFAGQESTLSTKHGKNASLLDLDDEEDIQRNSLCNRRFFGSNISRDQSLSALSQSVIDETLSTMSRAEFYGGYSPTNSGGFNDLSNYALARSRFTNDTLDRIPLNRASNSGPLDSLSCDDKLEPVVSTCDEEIWSVRDRKGRVLCIDDKVDRAQKDRELSLSSSVLSVVACFLCSQSND